jgi:Arc/MetJ-type ribon-helix-helix transcriptional regulator
MGAKIVAPSMKKLSVSLTEDHVDILDDRQETGDVSSRSAAVRDILDEWETLRTECDGLRTECDELRTRLETREARIEELEEQLARRSQLEDKIEGLPDKLRDAESYQERRQRMLDKASFTTRLKWKVTGVPVEDEQPA